MTNSTVTADIGHSLRRTQAMIRDAIQQTSDVDEHLKNSTEQLRKILGLHELIDAETQKGKGILYTLKSRAFWDKNLYKVVFIIYVFVVFYIVTRHFGNLFYRIYDWICYLLSFFMFWLPGFDLVCGNNYSNAKQDISVPDIDEQFFFEEDPFSKAEL